MSEQFSRTAALIGQSAMERLAAARIAVLGLGGVGSYTVEALARSGVGSFLLVDNDAVAASNINRQLHATLDTVGSLKTELEKARILSINPEAEVKTSEVFCLPDNIPQVLAGEFDYIVDAIDTVSAKIAIALLAYDRNIRLISAMGAGNKLDPTGFQVSDIFSTSVCPLCRVMRAELKKRDIPSLKVVYSKEPPVKPAAISDNQGSRRSVPASIAFVPPVMGLILAGEVIKDILDLNGKK